MPSSCSLSIIIPVYNVGPYLEDCLDSLLQQNLQGIEILLINDGSTDESGFICDEFARQNQALRVFHKRNEGVSIARNLGIEQAHGDWISFVDPDDIVSPNYIDAFRSLSKNQDDLVFFSLSIFNQNGDVKQKILEDKRYIGKTEMQKGILRMMVNPDNCEYFVFTVNKFFKRKIITDNNIRFTEHLTFREDELFTLDYCRHVDSFSTCSECLYHYRVDIQNSLSHKEKPITETILFIDKFLEKTDYLDSPDIQSLEADRALHFLINAYRNGLQRNEIRSIIDRITRVLEDKKDFLKHLKKTKFLSLIVSLPRFVSYPVIESYLNHVYISNKKDSSRTGNQSLW